MSQDETDTPPARILVVDDDAITRQFLSHLLGRQHNVLTVGSGEQALEVVANEPFDLILLDVMLPNMNGLTVLEHVKEMPHMAYVPVVLLTARSDTTTIVQGFQKGANDFIQKPFENSVIMARINTQLTIKRLLDERQAAVDQLQLLHQMRTQFSRIASHDLKNPLNNINMAAHLVRQTATEDSSQRAIDGVLSSVEAMENVIDNFVDMLDLQMGDIELQSEPVSLQDVIVNVMSQYEIASQNKQITLGLGATDGVVMGDRGRMIQALANLVSNAIKYSPCDSEIMVYTEYDDDQWRVCVKDQGPGVLPQERDLLFRQFSRPSNRPTANEASSGLGLWIVRHLMQMQGGDADAYFPADGGSIFYIQAPEAHDDQV